MRSKFGLLAILLSLSVSLCYAANPDIGFVSAERLGQWDMSGFNLDNARLSKSDREVLSGSGARVVRFHVPVVKCGDCNRYAVDRDALERLGALLDALKHQEILVIVVIDPKPKGRVAGLWDSESLQASLVEIWEGMAQSFSGNRSIAAFDLLNEPDPDDGHEWYGGSAKWEKLAFRLGSAVRKMAPNHALMVQSAPDGLPGAFQFMRPIPLANVVYSFHFYEPHRLTHQGVRGFPAGLNYPGFVPKRGYWSKARLSEYLDPVRAFQRRYEVPIYVGEFGYSRFGVEGSRGRYIKDFVDLVRVERWGWLYHAFREWNGWDAEISSSDPNVVRRDAVSKDFELLKSYLSDRGEQ